MCVHTNTHFNHACIPISIHHAPSNRFTQALTHVTHIHRTYIHIQTYALGMHFSSVLVCVCGMCVFMVMACVLLGVVYWPDIR